SASTIAPFAWSAGAAPSITESPIAITSNGRAGPLVVVGASMAGAAVVGASVGGAAVAGGSTTTEPVDVGSPGGAAEVATASDGAAVVGGAGTVVVTASVRSVVDGARVPEGVDPGVDGRVTGAPPSS